MPVKGVAKNATAKAAKPIVTYNAPSGICEREANNPIAYSANHVPGKSVYAPAWHSATVIAAPKMTLGAMEIAADRNWLRSCALRWLNSQMAAAP